MGACASHPVVVEHEVAPSKGKQSRPGHKCAAHDSRADSAADIHDTGSALERRTSAEGVTPAPKVIIAAPEVIVPAAEVITPAADGDISQERQLTYAERDALGMPYDVYERGPPLPPCNKERIEYMKRLGTCFDLPPDPQVAHVITLMCQVFNTTSALMALVDADRIFIRNAEGFSQGDFPWRWSFCAWSLSPPEAETLVIEDATQDARFKDNKMVLEHGVRFYCGTPLIGSNGHRLGTLCFVDDKPRKMEAHNCMILSNMAEMVVRELERDMAMQQAKKQNDEVMLRALDCFDHGVCFVDTSTEKWQALHSNSALAQDAGLSQETFTKAPFWELFAMPFEKTTAPWVACKDVASRGGEFVIHGVQVAGAPERGSFTMRFRPAGKDVLDENTPLVGVPAVARHNAAAAKAVKFYFAIVTREYAPITSASTFGSPGTPPLTEGRSNLMPDVVPFEDLELGPLLGKGSFGRVYRGYWEGSNVAVKICSSPPVSRSGANYVPAWKSVEAVLGRSLEHPHIVRTFKHSTVLVQGEQLLPMWSSMGGASSSAGGTAGSGGTASSSVSDRSEAEVETWMILEYCDKGSLQGGIDRGWFRFPRSTKDGRPHLPSILAIAADIASAMAYLHAAGIVHGDLCGGNVLLTSDEDARPHGFSAKIADFGISRHMQLASRIETTTYGTVTHMPPELLSSGELSNAADVYSFGVILNEMFCGVRAWASMSPPQILHAVAVEGRRPQFPAGAPPDFVALSHACMDPNPAKRPTFAETEPMIEALRREFRE